MTYSRLLAMAGLALMALSGPAFADAMMFKADMKGASEVPATDSSGSGNAMVTLDTATKKLAWKITYDGLTGDPTAAHFHGPAAPGANAGPVVDISANLAEGTADLTDAQIADLQAGKWYVNIHTAKFPDGEIRGQVEAAKQ
ncbi:MAG: CHRD domain-containing protein [Parvibaculaceae bacterium]